MQLCEKEKPQMQLKPATVTVRKFVVGALFTKTPSGSWSLEPSVQSKETLKVTEFSSQGMFTWNLSLFSGVIFDEPDLDLSCLMGIHQATSPGPPCSDCQTMPLFWRVFLSSNCSVFILSPKVIPTFLFLFTFKPSQALLSL